MGENSQFRNNVHNVPIYTFIKHGLINNVHNVSPPNNLKTGGNIQFWNNGHNFLPCTFIKLGLINNVHNVPPPYNHKTGETTILERCSQCSTLYFH